MPDYSEIHTRITDLFAWPSSAEQWKSLELSKDQVDFFHENGYLAGVRLLNEQQIAFLKNELNDFFEDGHEGQELWHEYHRNEATDPGQVLFHALGAWRLRPGFHDVLWNAPFVVAASQLLGGAVRFWHDQLFCKPARHGGVVAWHQDYSYWTRTTPMQHLTCWIGLDASHVDNGCLNYVPGSHRWRLLPTTDLAGDMNGLEHVMTEEQLAQFSEPVAIELAAGECAFHHPLMVHGSFANKTPYPRRAVVLNVCRDGVCSATNEELLAGIPPVPKGEKLDGQFFPLLFQPDAEMR